MKRPVKSSDGLYHIKGKTYKQVRGSRIQVWNSNAYKTEGGLHRSQLTKSNGRIVSLKKHNTAKKENSAMSRRMYRRSAAVQRKRAVVVLQILHHLLPLVLLLLLLLHK